MVNVLELKLDTKKVYVVKLKTYWTEFCNFEKTICKNNDNIM